MQSALDRSKNPINSVDKWVLIHSSDEEDDADQNKNSPTAVASDLTMSNGGKHCLLESKYTIFSVKKSTKPKLFSHQTTNRSEEKPNRERKSAERAAKRGKKQLFDEIIDIDEIDKDVYDFDEGDSDVEPVLKKKRRVTQQKKKKNKPVAWPKVKIEPMAEKKRSQKVYTIRVKKPVHQLAKVLAAKAEHHETDLLSNVAIVATEFKQSVAELSINPPEFVMAEADWILNEVEIAVTEPRKVTKAAQKPIKAPKLTPSTVSPLKLIAMEIITNIERINGVVEIDSNDNTGYAKPQRKSRSDDIIPVDSSIKPQTKKKPQPRKLYTEPEPEFDSIDLDQATLTKVNQVGTKNQNGQETDEASRLNTSNDSNDELIIETSDISTESTDTS